MHLRQINHLVIHVLFLILSICPIVAMGSPLQSSASESSNWKTIKRDYVNFYTSDRLSRLGFAFGIGSVMANTHFDQGIRDWYQEQIRTPNSDNISKTMKEIGNGYKMIPVSLLAMWIGHSNANSEHSVIGEWGHRSFRAYLVGGPANVMAQVLTGGSRPGERPDASHWRPFQDTNGVSGHTFVGAVPFLTIAHMTTNRYVRYAAYVASTFAGWSRINDDAHFASQVFLGWYMAYEATETISDSYLHEGKRQQKPHIAIVPWPHGAMMAITYRWN